MNILCCFCAIVSLFTLIIQQLNKNFHFVMRISHVESTGTKNYFSTVKYDHTLGVDLFLALKLLCMYTAF